MCYHCILKRIALSVIMIILLTGVKSVFSQDKKIVPPDNSKKFAVETIHGVPMITIDGNPVRGRIFWGRTDSGDSRLTITPERQIIDFEYSPLLDAHKVGTVHFRFEKKPGTIIIDDFSITEVRTGKKITGPFTFDSEKEFTDHWKVFHTNVNNVPVAEVSVGKASIGKVSVDKINVDKVSVNNANLNKNNVDKIKVAESDNTTKSKASDVTAFSTGDSGKALVIKILPGAQQVKNDFHLYHKHVLDLNPREKYRIHFTIQSNTPHYASFEFYRPDDPHVNLGSKFFTKGHFFRQVQMAGNAGVNFVSFLYRNCWQQKDGSWDWSDLDLICDTILAANPNALIIPRPGMNAPRWWLDQNPEERMVWKDSKPFRLEFGNQWASPASLKYRKAACEALDTMIRHLEEKYGASMAGYHPYGQNTGEWFTVNTWGAGLSGFGIAEEKSWRNWLREKYQSDENLQKVWQDHNVTLKNAVVPSAELRRASMSSPFLDPKVDPRHQSLLDFNIWTQKEMTDTIKALAKTVRKATNGKKLSLFFYGYNYEFSSVAKGPAASAHYNMRALLDSPDIDIICSPLSYFDRQAGGGGSCMLTAESVTAAGKIYLYEDDTRTSLAKGSSFPGSESGADSLSETRQLLLRNTAESAVRNFALWWMDLGGTGWFEDPRLWDLMKQLKETDEYFLKNPVSYKPEIGVFLDEYSVLKISSGKYSARMIGKLRQSLNRLGAPYGQYLLDDLLNGKVTAPKLCLILNPKCLTDQQIRQIKNKTQNSTLHFVDLEGMEGETLRDLAKKAKIHLYTKESCNVWASGPYAVLHAAENGPVHFTALGNKPVYDALSGKKLSDNGKLTLNLKKGETKLLVEK